MTTDSVEWACRTVDALKGTRIHEFATRARAEWEVAYYERVYATRDTYGGRAELVHRSEGGEWVRLNESD